MAMRDAVRNLAAYRYTAQHAEVKLNQNESGYDLPEALKGDVLRRLADIPFNRYPEMQADALRNRLAAHHDWPAEGIVVASGSNVLIQCLVIAGALGRTVVTVSPTFPIYALEATLLDAGLVELPLAAGFTLPTAALQRALGSGEGVAFLANPATPTGNLHPADDIERVAEVAGPGWILVLDEAYAAFSGRDHLALVRAHSNLVSLRTFSKAFGLGGVRLGYALMDPALATEVQKVVLPFSVSELQIAAAEVVLDHPGLIAERVAEVQRERQRLLSALSTLDGVEPYVSHTNFVLSRTPDAAAVFTGLLERGVLVRRQDHLANLSDCLRFSIGRPAENDRLLEALGQTLEQMSAAAHG